MDEKYLVKTKTGGVSWKETAKNVERVLGTEVERLKKKIEDLESKVWILDSGLRSVAEEFRLLLVDEDEKLIRSVILPEYRQFLNDCIKVSEKFDTCLHEERLHEYGAYFEQIVQDSNLGVVVGDQAFLIADTVAYLHDDAIEFIPVFEKWIEHWKRACEVFKSAGVSLNDLLAYERVRQSGITNMFDLNMVSNLSGLPTTRVVAVQKNHELLSKLYPNVRERDLNAETPIPRGIIEAILPHLQWTDKAVAEKYLRKYCR